MSSSGPQTGIDYYFLLSADFPGLGHPEVSYHVSNGSSQRGRFTQGTTESGKDTNSALFYTIKISRDMSSTT